MSHQLSLRIPATAEAPALARAHLNAHLGHHRRAQDATLALSELVTNAIRHGHHATTEPIEVRFSIQATGRLRIEVINIVLEPVRPETFGDSRPSDAPGGWGLDIVDSVALSWGVEPSAHRTLVWFVL